MTIDTKSALEFTALTKRYGNTDVVSSLSLRVRHGSTFGLVGANGAGKTTVIKCLLDFCDLDEGTIAIYGVPSSSNAARSHLAYLPERFVPPYYLTAHDFLEFMARLYGCRFDIDACRATLASLDLDYDVLAKPVRTLSKGMTQKLGIAGCLLSERKLLILDEPSSGLDPKAAHLFRSAAAQARARGRTVFLTSHSLAEVEDLCDEMAVMDQGKLRFAGSPSELKDRYQTTDLERAFLNCIGDT